ncbi:hypothetical protein B9Z55_020527 [Caenorhabditis nigoni]|uniref:Uncharacterized protein n=1 Tax=Caenorhabditis nigoni TaxID=1611254 RepID=A0A2G5TN40_9PELO|nr:hypothetical protein B9Z55_020527 [Caenorhabditis nigoni]
MNCNPCLSLNSTQKCIEKMQFSLETLLFWLSLASLHLPPFPLLSETPPTLHAKHSERRNPGDVGTLATPTPTARRLINLPGWGYSVIMKTESPWRGLSIAL